MRENAMAHAVPRMLCSTERVARGGALLIRGLAPSRSRVCGAPLRAAPRPGHQEMRGRPRVMPTSLRLGARCFHDLGPLRLFAVDIGAILGRRARQRLRALDREPPSAAAP